MVFLITVFLILSFTGVIFILNKLFKTKICPVCGGVSFTWILLILAKYLGYEIDTLIPAILMGGSAVGIAYSLEKFIASGVYSFLWKALFIPAGFIGVYGFFAFPARIFFVSLLPVLTVVMFFFAPNIIYSKEKEEKEISKDKKNIQEKLKNCC